MQNSRLIFLLFVTLAALAACAPRAREMTLSRMPQAPAPGDWTMYQYAPDHNAVFARTGLRTHWSFDAKARINGGLAVVGNTLILDTFGKEVIALDVRTGSPIWHTRVPNIAMSTPVVVNGIAYVGTGANDMLNRANPVLRLQFAGKDVWGVPGGDEIVAMNVRDGSVRWRYHTVGEDMPSPVYDRGRVVFANGDWHAYALDARTGKVVWKSDIRGVSTMASATRAGPYIIVAACADGIRDSSMFALNPDTGRVVWESSNGHCDASPAYAEGKIFTADVEPNKIKYVGHTVVAALDPKSGNAIWRYRERSPGVWTTLGSGEAAIAGTYCRGIYYQPAPLNDQLIAFKAASGNVRWIFHTAGPVKMSPVIKDNRVYVGDTVGVFYEIDASTGALLRVTPFKKPFTTSPPVIVGQTIFLVNGESVYAVELGASQTKEASAKKPLR